MRGVQPCRLRAAKESTLAAFPRAISVCELIIPSQIAANNVNAGNALCGVLYERTVPPFYAARVASLISMSSSVAQLVCGLLTGMFSSIHRPL
jgi:hypothetical protein